MPMGVAPLTVVKLIAEETEQHLKHVEEEDAAGGRDHAEAKLLRDLDESGPISE